MVTPYHQVLGKRPETELASPFFESGRRRCFQSARRCAFIRSKFNVWAVGRYMLAQQHISRQNIDNRGQRAKRVSDFLAAAVAAEASEVDHPRFCGYQVGVLPLRPLGTLEFKCRGAIAGGWSALYQMSNRRGSWGRHPLPRERRFTRTTQASPRG